jgi:hypothetical protein
MHGTIKRFNDLNILKNCRRYYSVKHRKQIIEFWKKKYNDGYVQIAPGIDLVTKNQHIRGVKERK